jgi:hypothetical protein
MSEFIEKPFRVIHKDNLKIEISICPICHNKNYFIFNKETGTWEKDFSRCVHYAEAKVERIKGYVRLIAVYKTEEVKE